MHGKKVVESNNKNIQALLEVVDLLAKREERKRAHDSLICWCLTTNKRVFTRTF